MNQWLKTSTHEVSTGEAKAEENDPEPHTYIKHWLPHQLRKERENKKTYDPLFPACSALLFAQLPPFTLFAFSVLGRSFAWRVGSSFPACVLIRCNLGGLEQG